MKNPFKHSQASSPDKTETLESSVVESDNGNNHFSTRFKTIADLWNNHLPKDLYDKDVLENAPSSDEPLDLVIKAYVRYELENVPKHIYISELPFYPFLTTRLIGQLRKQTHSAGKVVVSAYSTMLPRHFFNYPHDTNGSIELKTKNRTTKLHYQHLCFREDFVDDYRRTLQEQIAGARQQSKGNNTDTLQFHRYTILCGTTGAQDDWTDHGVRPSLVSEFLDDAKLTLETCNKCLNQRCGGEYCEGGSWRIAPVGIRQLSGPNSAILTLGFTGAKEIIQEAKLLEGKTEVVNQLVAQHSVLGDEQVYPIALLGSNNTPSLLSIFREQLHSPNACNVIVVGPLEDTDAQTLCDHKVTPFSLKLEDFSGVSSDFVHYALYDGPTASQPSREVFVAANLDLDGLTVFLEFIDDHSGKKYDTYKRFVAGIQGSEWVPSVRNAQSIATSKNNIIAALDRLSKASLFSNNSDQYLYYIACNEIVEKAKAVVIKLTPTKIKDSQAFWNSLLLNPFIINPESFVDRTPAVRFYEFAKALTGICTLLKIYPTSVSKMSADPKITMSRMSEMFESEKKGMSQK